MALREIRTYPDPVLREAAAPVKEVTDEIVRLAEDMLETMRYAHGAGLAANQVGVPIRLIVLEAEPDKRANGKAIAVINPVILERDSEETNEEGCLSFPKFYEYVTRARRVRVKGKTLQEEPVEMACEGYLARAFQHEIDHLNGVLLIDHLSPIKKNLFKKKYLKTDK
jgi:peptide deformylase